jgi:hypothetical protein
MNEMYMKEKTETDHYDAFTKECCHRTKVTEVRLMVR